MWGWGWGYHGYPLLASGERQLWAGSRLHSGGIACLSPYPSEFVNAKDTPWMWRYLHTYVHCWVLYARQRVEADVSVEACMVYSYSGAPSRLKKEVSFSVPCNTAVGGGQGAQGDKQTTKGQVLCESTYIWLLEQTDS